MATLHLYLPTMSVSYCSFTLISPAIRVGLQHAIDVQPPAVVALRL